jgi:hypothetical protein
MEMETLGPGLEEMMLVSKWHGAFVAPRCSAALNFIFAGSVAKNRLLAFKPWLIEETVHC